MAPKETILRNPARLFPIRTLSLVLALGWLVPGSAAATPTVMVAISGTQLVTGASFSEGAAQFQVGGELLRLMPLGTAGINGGPHAEGFAADSGTFWGSVKTGLEPYDATAVVTWGENYVKQSARDTIEAAITGGSIVLTDFGGLPSIDFLGSIEFVAFVDHPSVSTNEFEHVAEVTGSYGDWMLAQNSGDLAINTEFVTGPGDDTATWTLEAVTLYFELSSIPGGDSFGVQYRFEVHARGRGGETSAAAYFRDPISLTGGITVTPHGPIPVPEPGTLGLGAIGLAALGMRRARR
jgi:hypothetical protein